MEQSADDPELQQCLQKTETFVIYNKQATDRPTVSIVLELAHTGRITDAQFSQDGRYIATASGSTASVYELATGARVASFWHEGEQFSSTNVAKISFTMDAGHLLCALSNGKMAIWDIKAGNNWIVDVELNGYRSIEFSKDGRLLVGVVPGFIHLFDINVDWSGKVRKRTTLKLESDIDKMAISGDTKLLATSTPRFLFWDTENGVRSNTSDTSVTFWDTENGARIKTVETAEHVYYLAFSTTGTMLVTQEGGSIMLRDLTNQNLSQQCCEIPVQLFQESKNDECNWNVSWSADDNWVVSTLDYGAICLWRVDKGEPQFIILAHIDCTERTSVIVKLSLII